MTRQEVFALPLLSGAALATQRVRVGHITLSDRCRRPVGREKRKNRDVSFLGHAPYAQHPQNRGSHNNPMAEVRRRVPTLAPTGRTRPRAQGPNTNQRPDALSALGAPWRRYVGAGSNIKTNADPTTSEGRPVRTRHNRNVAPPGPPPAALMQPIRCRARSHHTAAARHWPLPRAAHHAVCEVDTKTDSPESVDSHLCGPGRADVDSSMAQESSIPPCFRSMESPRCAT